MYSSVDGRRLTGRLGVQLMLVDGLRGVGVLQRCGVKLSLDACWPNAWANCAYLGGQDTQNNLLEIIPGVLPGPSPLVQCGSRTGMQQDRP